MHLPACSVSLSSCHQLLGSRIHSEKPTVGEQLIESQDVFVLCVKDKTKRAQCHLRCVTTSKWVDIPTEKTATTASWQLQKARSHALVRGVSCHCPLWFPAPTPRPFGQAWGARPAWTQGSSLLRAPLDRKGDLFSWPWLLVGTYYQEKWTETLFWGSDPSVPPSPGLQWPRAWLPPPGHRYLWDWDPGCSIPTASEPRPSSVWSLRFLEWPFLEKKKSPSLVFNCIPRRPAKCIA